MWTDEDMKRAEEEDRLLQRVLEEARNRPDRPMSTPESIAAGNAAMAEGREKAAETLARRIESKELLSAAELRSALGITQAEFDDAVGSNRLFAFEGPGGQHYYPAFYADANVDRPALERVAQNCVICRPERSTTSSRASTPTSTRRRWTHSSAGGSMKFCKQLLGSRICS